MTLIAAFRCEEGVVLCADSQETIDIPGRGSYRVNVNKLERKDAGQYEVIIGGAGDGALVDGFVDQLAERISEWPREHQESELLSSVRQFVRDYYATDVALSPAYLDDKNLGFVICLRRRSDGNISLWRVIDLNVRDVPELTLLGWEEPLYWREAKRLYHLGDAITAIAKPSISEAILLGVHLFSVAKDSSNVISGETKILAVRGNSIHEIRPDDVKELEARIKVFESLSAMIFLALPDVTIGHTEIVQYLRDFEKAAVRLHNHFKLHIALTLAERLKALPGYPHIKEFPEDPYLQLPTFEQTQKDLLEDENMIAIHERAESYRRQADAEIGWERFVDVKSNLLLLGLRKTVRTLNTLSQLNRAYFESGRYGQVESEEVKAIKQDIAKHIDTAREELRALLESESEDGLQSKR